MYEDIVKHAPAAARQRIQIYAESVEEVEDPAELLEKYGVKDLKELVQHLVEYESGTPYDVGTDKLIPDYKLFWEMLDKVYGTEKNAVDEIRSKQGGKM